MIAVDQHRMNTGFDSFRSIFCHAKQLDRASHLFGVLDIGRRDFGNAFGINIFKCHSGVERCRSKDCYLATGIKTFHICGRVCFCIAHVLRQTECIAKLHAFLRHFCENEICGTVENTHQLCDMIGGKALFHRTDDRNSSRHGCLIEKIFSVSLCCRKDFFALGCHQVFVCRYNILSCIQAGKNVIHSRLFSTHNLNNNLDLRVIGNVLKVRGNDRRIVNLCSCFFHIAHENFFQLHTRSQLRKHFLLLAFQHFVHTGTDGAKTQHSDFNYSFLCHTHLSLLFQGYDAFNFYFCCFWKSSNCYTGTSRFGLAKESTVYFVYFGKIVHIGQENGCFHHFRAVSSCCCHDCVQIL